MTDNMKFNDAERGTLLDVRGIGPTVIGRLEEMGIASFAELATQSAEEICAGAAALVGSSCWKNSPQALGAIRAAVDCARSSRNGG